MASLGDIAIGMAMARASQGPTVSSRSIASSMLLWSALSFLPDADVLGFRLGVPYADPWGHRGATHSLVFAIGLGLLVGALAAVARGGFVRTAVFASLVVASHGILDALTDGGLGCALLWPFDSTRYFAPWRPIPVSPIGSAFFSSRGLHVAAVEVVLFLPLFLYATWPRAPRP